MLVRCAVQEFCTGAVPGLGPWAARTLRLAPSGSLRPRPQPRESALWLVFTGYRRGSPAPPLRVAGCGTRGRLWPTSRADALRGPPCCEWVPLAGSRGCLTGADASLRALLRAGPSCGAIVRAEALRCPPCCEGNPLAGSWGAPRADALRCPPCCGRNPIGWGNLTGDSLCSRPAASWLGPWGHGRGRFAARPAARGVRSPGRGRSHGSSLRFPP